MAPAPPAPPASPAGWLGRSRGGFTLIEMLVTLVLVGVISGAVYQMLLTNQRVYRRQAEQVELNSNVRAAVTVLPLELLELDAGDALGSDIVFMNDAAIAYKAMRNVYFLCQPAVDAGTTGSVTVWQTPWFGLRGLDAARDSMFLFAEADPSTRTDNYWVHANVVTVTAGTNCPGSAASWQVQLGGVAPAGGLVDVGDGAPARSFEVVELLAYADVLSDWWLGRRQHLKGSGWGNIEPVLGPLAPSGLYLTYFDQDGNVTATPSDVARVVARVSGQTTDPVRGSSGALEHVMDTLTVQIALRNHRR